MYEELCQVWGQCLLKGINLWHYAPYLDNAMYFTSATYKAIYLVTLGIMPHTWQCLARAKMRFSTVHIFFVDRVSINSGISKEMVQ